MITTIEQLKAIIPTIAGDDIALYQNTLDSAYRWISREILGPVIFECHAESIDAKIDAVAAYRAYKEVIPMLDVINTGNGFIVINDDSFSPASRERVTALVTSIDRVLTDALADLYECIEDHKDIATEFMQFERSSIIEPSLLPTLREFRSYGAFNGGYAEWISMRHNHRLTICSKLYPRFGSALMSDVLSSPDDKRFAAIIDPLKYAFAALLTDGNDNTAADMLNMVSSELCAHPELYPQYSAVALKPLESTSVISFL